MHEAINTLVSVPFAIAITALLRKRFKQIDGAYVAIVVLALTVLGAVLSHYHEAIPSEVWTAAAPVLAAILALGGVTTAQHIASPTVGFPEEAPTKKEGR
jgi:disulfide bond formation protein DsbB